MRKEKKTLWFYPDDLETWNKWANKLGFSLSELVERGTNVFISILEIMLSDDPYTELLEYFKALQEYYLPKLKR